MAPSGLLWPKIFFESPSKTRNRHKNVFNVVLKGSIVTEEWALCIFLWGKMIHNHAWLRILRSLEWGSTTKGEETITGGVCCFGHTLCQTFPG